MEASLREIEMVNGMLEEVVKEYQPRGAAQELFYCKGGEVLVEGPAGTGKTRAVLEKMHLCLLKYPGARGLIVRKTRASMTESVLVTYEEKVVGAGNPMLEKGGSRRQRQSYAYENGSHLVVGGMDNAGRIMSTEFDLIAAFEATELTEDDWERLMTRLRNGVMPFQQGVADCNPEGPGHWLNRRADGGGSGVLGLGSGQREGEKVPVPIFSDDQSPESREKDGEGVDGGAGKTQHAFGACRATRNGMVRLRSRHEDNPTVTEAYLNRLDALSGVRRLRLKDGVWAASEGMVYDVFDANVHVVDAKALLPGMVRWTVVGVDWGYRDAGVMQVWGVLGDGVMVRVCEHYHTGKTVSDWWAAKALEFKRQYNPRAFVCDPSQPASIEVLKKAGVNAVTADNNVRGGIDRVYDRMAVRNAAGSVFGAGLVFLRDGLLLKDRSLVEAKLASQTVEEFESYVYANGKERRNYREEPVDFSNHGMDAMRYAVGYVDAFRGGLKSDGVKSYRGRD
jgi:hypothetical protein